MPGIPLTRSPDLIPKVLDHVRLRPIPEKVNVAYLQSAKLTTKDDRYFISLLRGINFVSSTTSKPTERWKSYQDASKSLAVLTEAIHIGYAPLFAKYADAHLRNDELLGKVIRSNTKFTPPDVALAIASFRALCKKAGLPTPPVVKKRTTPTTLKPTEAAQIPAPPAKTVAKATVKPNTSIDLVNSELMEQAYKCVAHELFMPAHVMAWAAFMEFVFDKLSADDLAALHTLRDRWKGDTILEMSERIQERLFIETLHELGFCTKNQQERFLSLLDRRNDCAHPTSLHRPDLKETEGYISELIRRAEPLIERSL